MTRRVIETTDAPRPTAGAPYSQAIVSSGELVFTSGQLPVDPATGDLVEGDISEQTRQALRNLAAVLTEAGSGLDLLVKTTVYLRTREEWAAMNAVYREFVGDRPPARTAVVVGEMGFDARVEIDAVALVR